MDNIEPGIYIVKYQSYNGIIKDSRIEIYNVYNKEKDEVEKFWSYFGEASAYPISSFRWDYSRKVL